MGLNSEEYADKIIKGLERVKNGDYSTALEKMNTTFLMDWLDKAKIDCAIYCAVYTGKIPSCLEKYSGDFKFRDMLGKLREFFNAEAMPFAYITVSRFLEDFRNFPYDAVFVKVADEVKSEMDAFIKEIEDMDERFKTFDIGSAFMDMTPEVKKLLLEQIIGTGE